MGTRRYLLGDAPGPPARWVQTRLEGASSVVLYTATTLKQ
jgi:hypothetical protein